MLKIQQFDKLFLLAFAGIFLTFSCTPSPRYGAGSTHTKNASGKPKKSSVKQVHHKKVMTGIASYYGRDFHGKLTANGEVYDMYGLTAAHKTLPLNTIVRVTNLDNDKSLILRINDRGPYIEGRILDCSYGAAKKLGYLKAGTARVRIEVIEWGDDEYMQHD
ncbi:MAG: septal ring lytic transglycosylase RlpA family protein [FCB group bacterium]|nr:septal ring lytic transglycosylase RlpA family protein [FCB group bacterium]